jgi:hypothetical protein
LDTRTHALIPAADIPLLYFGFAHACLAAAFVILIVDPSLPGPFFLHPRMVAVTHLVTLGWISGSILGAFYIVAPLALRMPLRGGWLDRMAFAAFAVGVGGMVIAFWSAQYNRMPWPATLVTLAALHVAIRTWSGLRGAVVPWPVTLHVALAFANMIAASAFGIFVGMNRSHAWFAWSPLSSAYAHLHLAVVGWATMMFVGLAYRLIPMIVPTAMPTGKSMALSAVFLEAGLLFLVVALIKESAWQAVAAWLIIAGLSSFVIHVRMALRHKLPPPAALPRPDWATWQTHVALLWLLVAGGAGVYITWPNHGPLVSANWLYGTAGVLGFLAQVITGMQGRLLPMHAWYAAFDAAGRKPPARSAHTLASPRVAQLNLYCWTIGVPVLALGFMRVSPSMVRVASVVLLAGVVLGALQAIHVVRASRSDP